MKFREKAFSKDDGAGKAPETIHGIFERSVRRYPGRDAVVTSGGTTSYEELNARSNRLARRLEELGIGAGDLVAIHLDSSVDLIAAVLAVLKVGAAYLPVTPDLPAGRRHKILEDAACRFMIADAAHPAPPETRARVIDLDAERAHLASRAGHDLARPQCSRDVAYCIYTSGSTGEPKGVLVSHAGMRVLHAAQAEWFHVSHTDRVMQFAAFGFDAFVFDLLLAFGCGAALVLREAALGPALVDAMAARRITIATLPPAFLARVSLAPVSTLRCVVSAGEACQARHLDALPEGCQLINAYGPTEATIWATGYRVERAALAGDTVPIGRPVAQHRVYILDDRLQPVPAGEAGQLYIAGSGLALGYLNRPGLTAERFIPDPFSRDGARMYGTGDLGRHNGDGNIEFLGRMDDQVKLRGFRIEPGEIEQALLRIDGVREAAVIAREDVPGDRRLVAYVVASADGAVPDAALCAILQRDLPDYMVPTAWVALASLPLNPNGKIDRKALPAPSRPAQMERAGTAPGTPTEVLLTRIWSQVLGVDVPGVAAGFRNLGGSSMQAVEVAFLAGKAFSPALSLPAPLGNITIAEYAMVVDAQLAGQRTADVVPDGRNADAALASQAQQQVFFLEQWGEAWRAYRCHASLRLAGSLSVSHLHAALRALVSRHEILRTAFHQQDGRLRRTMLDDVEVDLAWTDLSAVPGGARIAALDARIAEELQYRFDVAKPPLVRWHLFKLAEQEHVLVQSEHHYVHDGQSFRILLSELAHLYNAAQRGTAAALPAPEAQYGAFCEEEARWLQSAGFARERDRWSARLSGYVDSEPLFSDRRAALQHSFVGAQARRGLPASLCERITRAAARSGVSRYALMLAAFAVLCSKQARQRRFLIGNALANRTASRYRSTVGMFVNMLPVAIDAQPDRPFEAFLHQVSAEVDFALAHSRVPLGEIVKQLDISGQLEGYAPFDVGFSFHDSLPAAPCFDGLDVTVTEALSNGSAKFALNVVVAFGNATASHPGELIFEFSTDSFDRRSVDAMMDRYLTLLDAALERPGTPLAALSLPSPEERRQLLAWNDTGTDIPGASLHGLFAEQVARSPHAIAVECGNEQLDYAALNRRANRLAHDLRARGVGPDTLVAVCAERSLEMVVALLGILKAGGAYVPLNPDEPRQRLAYLLQDSQAAVLLAQRRLADRLPAHPATVFLDACHGAIEGCPDNDPPSLGAPQNLAYCIYTSGSTGQPKGALNHHAGIVNRLLWMQREFELTPGDVILQKTPFSFDVSVWEFFWPLLNGARLFLAEPGGHREPAYLVRTIRERGITTLHFVPSMLNAFLEFADAGTCPSLRRVFCSGEALPYSLQQRFFARFPGVQLSNLYGPTEAAVDVTHWDCRSQAESHKVPIGRPIANTRMHVLDDCLQTVAVGVQGELYIAGIQLARGYLNRAGLTAERFLPDPFGPAGSRMYRSGDLGRWLPDGTIEFLGRADDQVKIRGQRVELGEIEHALAGCAGVREAAVLARACAGDLQLVACIAAKDMGPAMFAALRTQLEDVLPEHMIPTAWVAMDTLPLGANGKIDRKALLAALPASAAPAAAASPRQAADSAAQGAVLNIFREVMGAPDIDAHDDLFARGLHSIAIMRFVARCRDRLGARIKVRDVYKLRTAHAIACAIDAAEAL